MATRTWISGRTGDFDVGANWQEGVAPQPGDTAVMPSVGNPRLVGEVGDLVPDNVAFTYGISAANPQTSPTSDLSLTDISVPSGFTINATLAGGTYSGGRPGLSSSPVLASTASSTIQAPLMSDPATTSQRASTTGPSTPPRPVSSTILERST